MAEILYGLHSWMDAAAVPAGAVHVSLLSSYVQLPMHFPFKVRLVSVQHNGPDVAAGTVVDPDPDPDAKSPNNVDAAVSTIDAALPVLWEVPFTADLSP